MAGIYVLRFCKIEPNINELNKHFQIKEVSELVKLKRKTKENVTLRKSFDEKSLRKKINNLFNEIDFSYKISKLREIPNEIFVRSVNKMLIKIRKKFF